MKCSNGSQMHSRVVPKYSREWTAILLNLTSSSVRFEFPPSILFNLLEIE